MNDIGVKIVESLKEQPVDVVSPSAVSSGNNDVDPLALEGEEEDPGRIKDSLAKENVNGVEEKDNCDENAKEENLNDNANVVKDNLVDLQAIKIKEELLKDDSNSQGGVEGEDTEKSLVVPKTEPPSEENEPFTETVVAEPVNISSTEVKSVAVTPKHISPAPTPKLREPSPVKEVPLAVPEIPKFQMKVEPEEEAMEVVEVEEKIETKTEEKQEIKPKAQSVNGEVSKASQKEDKTTKRRGSDEVETESPLKRLCQEVEKTFPQHDTMINDYIHTTTKNSVDEIQRHTEQLLSEIQTLRELAQKKEQEWNNILHLKKVKEEILLRLLRRKQVLSFEKAAEVNGSDRTDPYDYLNQVKNLAIDKSDEISGLAIKQPPGAMNPMMPAPVMPVTSHFNPMSGLPPPYDKAAHMQNMPKPVYPQPMMMPGHMPGFPRDMNGQLPGFNLPMGRQGPTKDVKSIIADYRQRNPEVTPRRGRRMKSILNPNMLAPRPIAPKMDGMNSLNSLNMLFNNLDMNQKAMLERLQQIQAGGLPNGLSFKDVLVQFANMQQSSGLIPPPREPHREGRRRMHEDMAPPGPGPGPSPGPCLGPGPGPSPGPGPRGPERRPSPAPAPPSNPNPTPAPTPPRLPPPPPYPEISLLPVSSSQESSQQNSLLHGILTKDAASSANKRHVPVLPTFQQASPASQCYSPTLAKLLTSPERRQSASALPTSYGQAKNCGEITITPVQPTQPDPQPEKADDVVQLDEEESAMSEGSGGGGGVGSPGGSGGGGGGGRLVIDEGGEPDAPLCQGCRRRDAQFVCAGCANQWYCSRDCQVAAWDEHSEMCSG